MAGTQSVIAAALTVDAEDGEELDMALLAARGTAAWLGENATYTATHETFGQSVLQAYKATARVVVSEELDADRDPEGQRDG